MNYFLNNFGIPIYFLFTFLILISLLFLFLGITFWFDKRLKLNKKLLSFFISIAVFVSAVITFYMLYNVPDYLNDGKIRYAFIQEKNDEKRLIIWFTRVDHPAGMTTVYSHRLKSYNINNGRQVGRQNLLRRYYWNDYGIYGPFGNKAWGYSEKSGVQLLDLYQPKILFNNKKILQKNPQLGSIIRIYDGYYYPVYDPGSHGLFIVNEIGEIYRINPDLSFISADKITREEIKYDRSYYIEWIFENVDDDTKTVHIKGTELSGNSKIFISPEIVDFWDDDSRKIGKIWVMHWSSIDKDADCLISYVNAYGQELKSINLSQLFKNKEARPYFAFLQDNEIYIYITCSYYTLSALRTDVKKGKILGRINYFK